MRTHCSQSECGHICGHCPTYDPPSYTKGLLASPYSMTLMSVPIASHYSSSHSYSCEKAASCASIYDMKPSVEHTHVGVCLAVIVRASCGLLSPRPTLTLTFTECCITYKVISQNPQLVTCFYSLLWFSLEDSPGRNKDA